MRICVIVLGIALICAHTVPIAEANPVLGPIIKEGLKLFKGFVKALTKIIKSGEINAAHKSLEKAFQKIKEDPIMYGLAAVEAADLAKDGFVKIIANVGPDAFDVKFKPTDDDQCLDVYVNDELVGLEVYDNLVNLTEDGVAKTLKEAAANAIRTYQRKFPDTLG